jgi:hypothetical protein
MWAFANLYCLSRRSYLLPANNVIRHVGSDYTYAGDPLRARNGALILNLNGNG